MIAFGPDVVRSLEEASSREWLETNGRGSYAMGTVAGVSTRRQHSLLSAALSPPRGRVQYVNRMEDALWVDNNKHPLSPLPAASVQEFRLDPFPVWIHEAAGVRLKKSVFMRYGEDTSIVLYEHLSGPESALEAKPWLSGRRHGALGRDDARFDRACVPVPGGIEISLPGMPPARITSAGGAFVPDPLWRRAQSYAADGAGGGQEDLFCPGSFRIPLTAGGWTALVISREPVDPVDAASWVAQERRLRQALAEEAPLTGGLGRALSSLADQFLVTQGDGVTVMSGYPGRTAGPADAVGAIPGLLLSTGRAAEAEKVLDVWIEAVSADAVQAIDLETRLWLVWAAQKYVTSTKDGEALKRWAPVLRRAVDAVEKGDRHGVHMDRDGLVFLPQDPGGAVKPVDIQALWYNALEFLAESDLKLKEKPRGYDKLAAIARASFNEKFWNAREEYPFHRLEGRDKDATISAGALLALGLPYEILDAARFAAVVARAEKDLLTPWGLRDTPAAPLARPWMLGPFLTAHAKAHGPTGDAKARQAAALRFFQERVLSHGTASLSEAFIDGVPAGCPVAARTAAEILRILAEENIPL